MQRTTRLDVRKRFLLDPAWCNMGDMNKETWNLRHVMARKNGWKSLSAQICFILTSTITISSLVPKIWITDTTLTQMADPGLTFHVLGLTSDSTFGKASQQSLASRTKQTRFRICLSCISHSYPNFWSKFQLPHRPVFADPQEATRPVLMTGSCSCSWAIES